MRHLLLLFGILLLASCFEVREEVWVHRDGSGRLQIDLTVPARAVSLAGGGTELRASLDSWFASNPQVVLESLTVHPPTDGGDQTLTLTATAPSLRDLATLSEHPSSEAPVPGMEKLAGDFDVRVSAMGIDFHRQLDLSDALGLAKFAITPSERRERKLDYIVHLPTASRSNNADQVLDGGRTLIWHRTLGQALAAPVEMRFQAPLPFPVLPIAAGGLVTLGLAAFFAIRRLRRGRS
ncbi:hypothetical protein [Haloferula sargassicola]|uniref:DUF3153 domain-containing protein n=1 Tax=Haloferula sargassicola TaxID=490096 RepID=A0ABP9ULS4_9BACT